MSRFVTWKKCFWAYGISLILFGMGFALKYAEDNQVGSSNDVSFMTWCFSGFFLYWGVLFMSVLVYRKMAKVRK